MDGGAAGVGIHIHEVITPHDVYVHGADKVLFHQHTEYQELCITESSYFGRKLFLDGIVQSAEADEYIYHEALVHPAALAAGAPVTALVLGGGEGATIREVLRWPSIEHVTMVDIDAELIAATKEWLPNHHQGSFEDPRVSLHLGDAVAFLAETDQTFDIVISDMTDPVENGPATFCFTVEFFEAIRKVMRPGGVLSLQAGPMAPVEIDLHAKVNRTLMEVFDDVVAYPCMAAVYGRPLGFCLASTEPIRQRIDPETADVELNKLTKPARYINGAVAHGLMATPVFVTAAIASGTSVYRNDSPPATSGGAGLEARG